MRNIALILTACKALIELASMCNIFLMSDILGMFFCVLLNSSRQERAIVKTLESSDCRCVSCRSRRTQQETVVAQEVTTDFKVAQPVILTVAAALRDSGYSNSHPLPEEPS